MTDYKTLQAHCETDSALIVSLIDDFLLEYCDEQEDLALRITRELAGYLHVLEHMPEGWEAYLLSQLIAHKLFGKRGLAIKYLNHDAVRRRSHDERVFLEDQITHPWLWRFAILARELGDDFFEMEDACTGDHYVLYSHSMKNILSINPTPRLFFMLTMQSGDARMIFGPITYFLSLLPSDLLSLARLIDPQIRRLEQVPDVINAKPVPFLMFWRHGNAPVVAHNDDILIHHFSEKQRIDFSPQEHKQYFTSEYKDGVWRLQLKRWAGHPHFAEVYYDTHKRHLMASALTARGWEKLVASLNDCGVPVSPEPQRLLGMTAYMIARDVLRKPPITETYAAIFNPPVSEEENEELDRMNTFIAAYIEEMNDGRLVDIKALAQSHGIDYDVAEQIVVNIAQKLK